MTKAATKEPAPLNLADFLISNASQTGPKKKKGGVPEFLGHGKLADRVAEAYKAQKDADAAFKLVEGELLTLTGTEYAARAKAGDHTKSMDLPGEKTPGVQVTYSDKFTALAVEQEPALKAALGERYDSFFEQTRVLTIKEGCTDDKHIEKLRAKLGDEMFVALFDIKITVSAKKDMDRRQFELPEGVAMLSGLKQNKASVKLLKKDE